MENMNNQGDVCDKAKLAGDDQAKQCLYEELDGNRSLTMSSVQEQTQSASFQPDGISIIPPFMLDEMAQRTGDLAYARAARDAEEMQTENNQVRPNVQLAGGARETYDAQTKRSLPGVLARKEGDGPTGNKEVDDAYDFTGVVRDFYKNEFNRDSIDGKGMKLVSTVNYGTNYENAFWNGSQMTYGRPGPNSPFKTFMLLDVAGHEITHGVTEKEAGTTYFGQSGALNESFSDIYGEMIQQYSKGQTSDQADWLVGDGIWKEGVNGRALRDMLNPGTAYNDAKVGKDPQPAHMKDYKKTWSDNGGVHYNSGIPNRAFVLFAQAVGGHSWDDPGHIWFTARKAAGSNPSFGSFAYETVEAAKALGKPDEVEKLQKAWEAVGVVPDKNAKDTATPRIMETLKKAS